MVRKMIKGTIFALVLVLFSVPVIASAQKQVVIDPGHGGKFSGTTGYSGNTTKYYEKQATLEVSIKLRNILRQQGYKVHMTRETDTDFASSQNADLIARMKKANGFIKTDNDNAIFISVHFNSIGGNPSMRGYETYFFDINNGINSSYRPDPLQVKYSPDSKRLANSVHRSVLQTAPIREGRGIVSNNLYVTRSAQMASILVELGYMSNPTEEKLIKTNNFQVKAAEGIVQGVNKYFNVFEVFDDKGKKLATFDTKNQAVTYATARNNVYVFDKGKQQKVFENVATRYEVFHSNQGSLRAPFGTEKEAIAFAKQWKNTRVVDHEANKVVWSNYNVSEKDKNPAISTGYVVKHSTQGEIFKARTEAEAIQYAKQWKNTAVINQATGKVVWSNYTVGSGSEEAEVDVFLVEHPSQGTLFSASTEAEAIKYAKQWKNTAVINQATGKVLWSNYTVEDKPEVTPVFTVEHSTQGVIFTASTEAAAIKHAKEWKNTAVINKETGKVVWSNYTLGAKPEVTPVFTVEHSAQGVLFTASTEAAAIKYAKQWLNTSVVNKATDVIVWSNYLEVTTGYAVVHSVQGELFKAPTEAEAIKYAKQWLNTSVINRQTNKVVWSNY